MSIMHSVPFSTNIETRHLLVVVVVVVLKLTSLSQQLLAHVRLGRDRAIKGKSRGGEKESVSSAGNLHGRYLNNVMIFDLSCDCVVVTPTYRRRVVDVSVLGERRFCDFNR